MSKENIIVNQILNKSWLVLAMVAGLLGGCGDTFDQTDIDINSPAAGLMRLGDQIQAHGDDEGAMEFYARATQRAPNEISPHLKLASLLETHNDNIDAADQYRMLTALDPENADYRRAYGRTLIKLGRPADARAQYEAALKIDGNDTRSQNGLGITLDLLGDHAGAQASYKVALEQKPDDLVTLNNLGHSYVLAGSYDEAIKLLEPQYLNPAVPPTLRQNLAEAYGMAGMDIDAERVMKKDLPPAQIKKNLAKFKTQRAKVSSPALHVTLGGFATSDLAQARIEKIKEQFAKDIGTATLEIAPEVEEIGGTPTFFVHANGFKNVTAAQAFCKTLKAGGAFCKINGG